MLGLYQGLADRDRDKEKCRICHKSARGRRGGVHHIDANKHNNEIDNLILLCKVCHGKVHGTGNHDNPVILAFRSMLNY